MKEKGSKILVKPKPDFCIEGSRNYIQKLIVFKFQKKNYMVIARSSGLIQLYEDSSSSIFNKTLPQLKNKNTKNYKLFKEWKNSNTGYLDEIVSIGFVNNRYLYSCSSDGKLIFRDLVNDDADESYKVYMIDGPNSCIYLQAVSDGVMKLFSAGKNNELKVYNIELRHGTPNLLASINEDIQILSSELRSTINLTYDQPVEQSRSLRRSYNNLNLRNSLQNRHKLNPTFISCSRQEDYIYKASPLDIITNWIVSVCYIGSTNEGSELIICGTQFGKLLVYDIKNSKFPIKVIHLSQFPIDNLQTFHDKRYLIYTDTMSKVGIIDINSFEIINFYDNLDFGPVMALKLLINDGLFKVSKFNNRVSKFDPIYLIATTIDQRLIVYKLYDDNNVEMKLNVQIDTLVPSVEIMDSNPYFVVKSLFDNETCSKTKNFNLTDFSNNLSEYPIKKRRLTSPIITLPLDSGYKLKNILTSDNVNSYLHEKHDTQFKDGMMSS